MSHLKHFAPSEFSCPCCNANEMWPSVTSALDFARSLADVPFIITSGYRCEDHNQDVGGSPTSSHLNGTAVDIHCADSVSRYRIITALLEAGFRRIGVADTFIHADMDLSKQHGLMWTYQSRNLDGR